MLRKQNSKTVAKGKAEMLRRMTEINEANGENYDQKKAILINFRNATEVGETVFMYVPLEYLKIDREHYQRPIYSHAHKIAEQWDERKCDPLIINYREDGYWYIIDGQHRYIGALENRLDSLVCKCFVGLSVEEESRIFSSVNILSKKLIPYETFKSNICHKEIIDTKIQNICNKYGVKIDNSKDVKSLRCISLVRRIIKKEANNENIDGLFQWTLETISKSNWHDTEPMAYSYKVINSLAHLYEEYGDNSEFVQDKICQAFGDITYRDVCAFANLEFPLLSNYDGFSRVLKNIVNGKISITNDIKNRIRSIDERIS